MGDAEHSTTYIQQRRQSAATVDSEQRWKGGGEDRTHWTEQCGVREAVSDRLTGWTAATAHLTKWHARGEE